MKIPLLSIFLLLPLWLFAQPDTVCFDIVVDQPEPLHPGQHVKVSYQASRPFGEFSPPDLSDFELLADMTENEGCSTNFENGVMTRKSYYSRSWMVVVPQADSVVFPGAEAVFAGRRYVCPPRTVRIAPVEVDLSEVKCSVEVMPENPEPGKPFKISVWLSHKPDEARPEIDLSAYGSKIRVLSRGMSSRSGSVEYSTTLMAWVGGVYEIPPMRVHFGGTPFRIEGLTVKIGQSQK